MDSPQNGEFLDDGADYEGKVVALDLEFLFGTFMLEGSEFHMRVVRGVPEGAKALAAGISDGSLYVVFDSKVPEQILFLDLNERKEIRPELN